MIVQVKRFRRRPKEKGTFLKQTFLPLFLSSHKNTVFGDTNRHDRKSFTVLFLNETPFYPVAF